MESIIHFPRLRITDLRRIFKENGITVSFFIILSVCLFLGDGKQPAVDLMGTAGIMTIWILARSYYEKKRELDNPRRIIWFIFLVYIYIRSLFSDAVGWSVYHTVRFLEAYLIFDIFYCYSTGKTARFWVDAAVIFAVFAETAAFSFTVFPKLSDILPLMNLLSRSFGHNHIVDILTMVFPAVVVLWFKTKKLPYLISGFIFYITPIFFLARWAFIFQTALLVSLGSGYLFRRFLPRFGTVTVLVFIIMLGSGPLILNGIKIFDRDGNGKQQIIDSRIGYWTQAVEAIRERPVFGAGPGTFSALSLRLQATPASYSWFAHSFILEQLAETGFAGTMILMIIILSEIAGIFLKVKNKSITSETVILLCALAAITYSLFDYSFSYLVVWWIFWGFLGVGAAAFDRRPATQYTRHNFGKPDIRIVILGVFYLLTVLSVVIFQLSRNADLSFGIAPYNTDMVNLLIEKHRKSGILLSEIQNRLINFFHGNDAEVMMNMADALVFQNRQKQADDYYLKAITLEPINTYKHRQYLKYLLVNKDYDGLAAELIRMKSIFVPQELQIPDQTGFLNNVQVQSALDSSVYENTNINEGADYFAAVYSRIALSIYKIDPEAARRLMETAVSANPGWSNIYIDYAGMLKYVYHEPETATRILNVCKINRHAGAHCREFTVENLPVTSMVAQNIRFDTAL